jgi:GT2 family glycosyltransferase
MTATPTMLEELLKTAQKEEKRGIVTPKIYYFDNKKIIWAAGTDINRTTGQTIFYGGEDHGQYEIEKEVAVAPAILLVKKKVLEKVKKFDTTYFATYEDTDFCFSAKKVGFSTYYTPHAVAYHKIPYDPQIAMKRLLERSYWVGRNRYLFLRKFGLFNAVSLLFIPIYILYYWLLAVQYRNYRAIGAYAKGVLAGLTTKV